MSCECIICTVRARDELAYERMMEAEIMEDTTDCKAREFGDLCGGCGECRRKQLWAMKVPESDCNAGGYGHDRCGECAACWRRHERGEL